MRESKNLGNLIVKHFSFLVDEHEFVYNASLHRYSKSNLGFEIEHNMGELKLFFLINKKRITFEKRVSEVKGKNFIYPSHFSSWVLSMGDVDSRLAYDAKLIKEYVAELLY
jgi:hypothetical protein